MNKEISPTGHNEIVIKDLVKNFGDVTAVNGLSLEIKKGEMFGFLGPNGAGKTTTISILCGLIAESAPRNLRHSSFFQGGRTLNFLEPFMVWKKMS